MRGIRSIVLLACLAGMSQARADRFRFTEGAGEYAVGFRVVQQYDQTRVFLAPTDPSTGETVSGQRARPIQTLIWYPAETSATPKLTYGDYLLLAGSEDRFDRSAEQIRQTADFRLRDYVPPEMDAATIAAIEQQPMWAARDAAPVARRFPVVIYAPSHNASAGENADLCEYLASRGYVVLASSSMGPAGRWMLNELSDVEAQVGDIEFLVGYASALADADAGEIAVIGYSWGGIANVFAAARDSRIRALVGFDGGIRLVGKLVDAAKYVTPERITVPYLYLASDLGSLEDLYRQKQDLSDDLLARLKYNDFYLVTFRPLVHYHFASQHLRFLSTQPSVVFSGEYSFDEINQAYGWLARYAVAFLDGTLKHDANAMTFVTRKPVENGLPPHAVSLDVEPAKGLPPTRASLAAEMHRKGFAHAQEIYDAMAKANPEFKLPPSEFSDWLEDLAALKRTKDAIYVAKVFTKTYSDRPGPYYRLAELQVAAGDKAGAVESYRKVLALDPANEDVKKKLATLGATK